MDIAAQDLQHSPPPTVADILRRHASQYPRQEALYFDGTRWTWEELYDEVLAVAAALQDAGLEPYDSVAILSENCAEFWKLFLASSISGVILCPINFRLVPESETVRYLVDYSESKLLFVQEQYREFAADVVDDSHLDHDAMVTIESEFARFVERANPDGYSPVSLRPEDPLVMLHTSGTTGRPKGALISHRAYVWNGMAERFHLGIERTDRVLQAMPLVHTGGLMWYMSGTFVSGASLILMPEWDPDDILRTLERKACTKTWGQEVGLNLLVNEGNPQQYDLKALRSAMGGAGPNQREWSSKIAYELGLDELHYPYGSTEAGLVSTTNGSAATVRKEGTVGRPVFSADVKIVDDEGREVPTGEVGELWVRSPALFSGYYNLPEKTDEVFEDGWYRTGDILREDEEGYLYFVNRKDDMIKTGGENVYPTEVERVLLRENPEIVETAVVGVDDPKWTEAVTAFVVSESGVTVDPEQIRDAMRDSIASFKIPKQVHVVDEVPKSEQGKILRTRLQEMAEERKHA